MLRLTKPSGSSTLVVVAPIFALLLLYIIPGHLLLLGIDDASLPFLEYKELRHAIQFSNRTLLTYTLLILIYYLLASRSFRQTIRLADIRDARQSFGARHRTQLKLASNTMAILALLLLIPAMGSWENVWHTTGRFAVASGAILSVQKLLALGALVTVVLIPRANLMTIILAAVAAGMYSFLISSRSVLAPFLILILMAIERRSFFAVIVSVVLATFFYFEALFDRQSVGLSRAFDLEHWERVFVFIQSGIVLGVWQSMWGVQTLTLAMNLKGYIEPLSWLRFALYLSPVPSAVMDVSMYLPYQSLSYHLGIIGFGLNSDVLGESYLWFGDAGAIFIGTMYAAMVILILNTRNSVARSLLFFGLLITLSLGSVASMRASTRPFLLVLTILLLHSFLRTISRRIKR